MINADAVRAHDADMMFSQQLILIRLHGYPITDGFFRIRPACERSMLDAALEMLVAATKGRQHLESGEYDDARQVEERFLRARVRLIEALTQNGHLGVTFTQLLEVIHTHGYPIAGLPANQRSADEVNLICLAFEVQCGHRMNRMPEEMDLTRDRLIEACAEAAAA